MPPRRLSPGPSSEPSTRDVQGQVHDDHVCSIAVRCMHWQVQALLVDHDSKNLLLEQYSLWMASCAFVLHPVALKLGLGLGVGGKGERQESSSGHCEAVLRSRDHCDAICLLFKIFNLQLQRESSI